jgi:hypothetical protein
MGEARVAGGLVRFDFAEGAAQQLQGAAGERLGVFSGQAEILGDGLGAFAVAVRGHDGCALGGRQLGERIFELVQQLGIRGSRGHPCNVFDQRSGQRLQPRRADSTGRCPTMGKRSHPSMVPQDAWDGTSGRRNATMDSRLAAAPIPTPSQQIPLQPALSYTVPASAEPRAPPVK